MSFDPSIISYFSAALFIAWVVGFLLGFVWTWTRKLFGDLSQVD